ncbi:glycosyltransferase [Collinsella sp. D33t1_170424_A12]|uniref:glycosyltransferase n=1 Tax=Collinsella sp. D33t1_170424_A12 TaxID=2787135 RepID=UPI0018992629|nr:glycosyltransferase [Collinsella sp. D33t1_170424_A12]
MTSKHRLLFVMSSMDNGGAERALLNLIEELPEEEFDIDLFLLNPNGLFMDQIPAKVNLLQTPDVVRDCFTSIRGRRAKAWRVTADAVSSVVSRDEETRRGFRWKHFYSRAIDMLPGHYDTAISFINGQVLYFVDEKVKADRKIVFYHGDYRSAHYSSKYELPHLQRMDGIYAISPECLAIIRSVFPYIQVKMGYLPNIVSSKVILSRAKEFYPPEYKSDEAIILTVARVTHEKGVDIAIQAAAELKRRGLNFTWFELGKGVAGDSELNRCRGLISELGVADVFKLLGPRENPYPYIANADIVVQPSRFEGKSVVLDESKILSKPIVATAYPTVADQVSNDEGLVVDIDPVALANGIESLVQDSPRIAEITEHLRATDYSNTCYIEDYKKAFIG